MSAVTLETLHQDLQRIWDGRDETRAFSVTRVEELTGVPRKAILAAIRTGHLRSIEIGPRTRVVRPDALDEWLAWREAMTR